MRFLANENFPLTSVNLLRASGHDILALTEFSPGCKDEDVLNLALREKRIILTFDRDYGELIYKVKMPKPTGLAYFRFQPDFPEEPARLLLQILIRDGFALDGFFTVIERERVRQRKM